MSVPREIESERPDFVIGLVGAVGSPLHELFIELQAQIRAYGYDVQRIHLSDAFDHQRDVLQKASNEKLDADCLYSRNREAEAYSRIRRAMATGTAAREQIPLPSMSSKNACLGSLAVHAISRRKRAGASRAPLCCIVDSLKRPEELVVLRRTYGPRLLVVGLHTPRVERSARLREKIQETTGRSPQADECATQLIGIDENERGTGCGQNIEGVFEVCDAFISAVSRDAKLRQQTERLVRLAFLDNIVTPTPEECAMSVAFTTALQSSSLSRNVGAAITSPDGDLVSTGFNEVPRFGGGPYTAEGIVDGRDCARNRDENDVQRRALVRQMMQLAKDAQLLTAETSVDEAAGRVAGAAAAKDMLARNITEFGRAVHAEMAAITSAAKRGVPLKGCTLHTTTFPCHNCAKHILSAGIKEVVFIEPYPKSFAELFYRDALSIDQASPEKMLVRAFQGIAPRLFPTIFAWRDRRGEDGGVQVADPRTSQPWFCMEPPVSNPEIAAREDAHIALTQQALSQLFDLESALTGLVSGLKPGTRKTRQSRPPDAPTSDKKVG